jgi:protein-S-isoprenylcysteine O-methyltransferase Ste14
MNELKPPKLFVWFASLVTISLILATQFLPRGGDPYLRGTGVFVLLLAGVFIFAPFYLLTKYGRIEDGQTYMQARIVVDRGLYAITRHPQYLGYILLAWGFAALSQHWVAVLLAVIGATFFYLQAVREERYCLAQLGELYQQYLRRVPRFNIVLGIMRLLQGSNVVGK